MQLPVAAGQAASSQGTPAHTGVGHALETPEPPQAHVFHAQAHGSHSAAGSTIPTSPPVESGGAVAGVKVAHEASKGNNTSGAESESMAHILGYQGAQYDGALSDRDGANRTGNVEYNMGYVEDENENASAANRKGGTKRVAPGSWTSPRKKEKKSDTNDVCPPGIYQSEHVLNDRWLTLEQVLMGNLLSLDDDVLLHILRELHAPDLYAFSQTGSRPKELSGAAIHQQVMVVVGHFIEPQDLLDVLKASSAIISGSLVLQLFSPGSVTPNDMDIYVPRGNLGSVVDFVTSRGYELSSRRSFNAEEIGYRIHLVTESLHYTRERPDGSVLDINILATLATNPIVSIVNFDFTWVMNTLTGRGLICLYREWTSLQMGLVNRRSPAWDRVLKYADRGFYQGYPYNSSLRACVTGIRSLHDEHSMYLAFKPSQAEYWYCEEDERHHEVWFEAKKERLYWALQAPLSLKFNPAFIFEAGGKNGVVGSRAF
ncbi:hypothetical protein NP233_g1387 [Leucocoprinus birnbaumii]|uniref:Uncharacterized protein n=1 Tax=Leucocoprinus birnbaumii TaxID=56174 RepID=A0AAD5W2B9_9AGAR|nr:hypothetical protein NP233_g1387 [Leucocoprinus birnbaumii]